MVRREEKRGFVYQKRTAEQVKERANRKGGNFDSIFKPQYKVWKPKEGKNRIRIMPATWKPAEHYGIDIWVNYGIGPDRQGYLSLSKHNKGPDPIAEARREAMAEGEKEYAKKLRPTNRILYWIIDRNDEEEGPMLWASPFTFDKALANLTIDEDTNDVLQIDHRHEGRDLRFYREGTMMQTKYDPSRMKLMEPSSLAEDEGQEEEWLEYIQENPLPDVLNFHDYDYIKAQFDGTAPETDDEEVEDDEKPRRKRANGATAKSRDDDDEDEKPQRRRAVRDDDDEDEKPARRRAARDDDEDEKPKPRRKAAEDEDDEKPARRRAASRDEDDDDEDEDERPTKNRRGKSDDDDGGGRSSLREKLAERRRSRASADD